MKARLASGLLFLLLSFGAFSQQVMGESHPHSRNPGFPEQGNVEDTADTPDEHLQDSREPRVSLQRKPWML